MHPARVALPKTKREILVDGRLHTIQKTNTEKTAPSLEQRGAGWGSCRSRQPRTAGVAIATLRAGGASRFLRARRNEQLRCEICPQPTPELPPPTRTRDPPPHAR